MPMVVKAMSQEKAASKMEAIACLIASCKIALFGGKGGVGKTTIAAACAIEQAYINPDKQILLVSLDPAHSLADLLKNDIQPVVADLPIQPVIARGLDAACWKFPTVPNLTLLELDFTRLTGVFQDLYGAAIETTAEQGTLLNKDEISAFINVSMPALGELMGLLTITDLIESNAYDHALLDTAPTGHTLRLLNLPGFLQYLTDSLKLMESKHEIVVSSLVGSYKTTEGDVLLQSLAWQADSLSKHLSDEKYTGVFVVTLAEQLPVEETERFVASLKKRAVPIKAILVNSFNQTGCPYCLSRFNLQTYYLVELKKKFPTFPLFVVPLAPTEPRSVDALAGLIRNSQEYFESTMPVVKTSDLSTTELSLRAIEAQGHLPDFIEGGRNLVIFAGKGGVGKTSIASASAWHLAYTHANKRILVASIDPAHSLGDSLGESLSNEPKQLSDNLWALEIDSDILLSNFRKTYEAETYQLFTNLLGSDKGQKGFELAVDKTIAEKLLNMDTPDLDEFMAFRRLSELTRKGKYDLIIIDPPPAGHFLRFLQLPGIAKAWIKATLTVINMHHAIKSCQSLVQELISLMHAIEEFEREISDNDHTEVVAVSTAREVVLKGASNMIECMKESGIAVRHTVINLVRPYSKDCVFCISILADERKQITKFEKRFENLNIVTVPMASYEVRGKEALSHFGETLYG